MIERAMIAKLIRLLTIILLATTPLSASAQKNTKAVDEQRKRVEQYKKSLDKAKSEVNTLKRRGQAPMSRLRHSRSR